MFAVVLGMEALEFLLLSAGAAALLRIPGGTITAGAPADLTVLAPDASVTIKSAALVSKSKNSPFDGWTLRGATAGTIVGGKLLYQNPDVWK